jgi:hypothetical protein
MSELSVNKHLGDKPQELEESSSSSLDANEGDGI